MSQAFNLYRACRRLGMHPICALRLAVGQMFTPGRVAKIERRPRQMTPEEMKILFNDGKPFDYPSP